MPRAAGYAEPGSPGHLLLHTHLPGVGVCSVHGELASFHTWHAPCFPSRCWAVCAQRPLPLLPALPRPGQDSWALLPHVSTLPPQGRGQLCPVVTAPSNSSPGRGLREVVLSRADPEGHEP